MIQKMATATNTLRNLANQAQYSTRRDSGYSPASSWSKTTNGGAIVDYEDGTCETFSAADLAIEYK